MVNETDNQLILQVADLKLSLGRTRILNGVTFAVRRGDTLGIIGPNGSGKTTLFNCLCGFNTPTGGSILFRGQDITGLPAHIRAERGIGRVFQNFGIFREMTVAENVLTAIESRQGFWEAAIPWSERYRKNRELVDQYLMYVGLQGRGAEKASSLSGGQMRLLEIIRTLAFGAELFLLDEPTAGVSPRMKDDIQRLIERLRSEGRTVMIIEHDINFIQKFCDRILVLDVGKVVLDDDPDGVRRNPMLQEIYFGSSAQADVKASEPIP